MNPCNMNPCEEEKSKVSISEVHSPALTLYPHLADHERKKIVTELLKQFELLTPQTRQLIERKFQRNLKMRGFSKFMNAPLPQRIDALLQHSLKFDQAATLVLIGWFERKYSIYQAISEYIAVHQKLVAWWPDEEAIETALEQIALEQTVVERGKTATDDQGEESSIIRRWQVDETFMQMHPQISRFDLIMVAACGDKFDVVDPGDGEKTPPEKAPLEDVIDSSIRTSGDLMEGDSIEQDGEAPWASWLRQAEALPATHPAWQQLDNFISDLRALSECKRESLLETAKIHSALAKLQAVDAELLRHMYLDKVITWQLPTSLPTPVAQIVAQLDELYAKSEEYQQVEAWPEKNLAEWQAKWQRLIELAGESGAIEVALRPFFTLPLSDSPFDSSPNSASNSSSDSTTAPDLTNPVAREQLIEEAEVAQEQNEAETIEVEDSEAKDSEIADNPAVAFIVDGSVEEEPVVAPDVILDQASSELDGADFAAREVEAEGEQEEDELPFSWQAEGEGIDDLPEEAGKDESAFWLEGENIEADIPSDANVDADASTEVKTLAQAANASDIAEESAGSDTAIELSTRSADDDEYLWEMVEDGDLAGAYWFARAMINLGQAPVIPPELLAAVQGSALLTAETMLPYAEDLREIARHYQPDQRRFEHLLLGVAAALSPIILSPSSELLDWLNVPAEPGWLLEFVTPIREFGFYGVGLSADVLPGVTDVAQLEEQQRQIVVQANEWWAMAPHRRRGFTRSVDIWHDLIKPTGLLSEFFQPVLNNDATALNNVREKLARWQTSSYVDSVINEIDHAFSRTKKSKIDGSFRDYLKRGIDEASRHAAAWVRVTEEIGKHANQGDWLAQQATKLLVHLKQSLPGVIAALAELQNDTYPLPQRAAAEILANALHPLARIFALNERVAGQLPVRPFATWAKAPYPQWAARESESIAQALNRRLLLLPEVDLHDDGTPTDEAWQIIFDEIEIALRPIPKLFTIWLEKQDYRFIDRLLALHPAPAAAKEEYAGHLEGTRAALQAMLQESQNSIEQAVVDGIINDVQRTEYLGQVTAVKPNDIKNFAAEFSRLEKLESGLREAKAQRMEQLKQQWAELSETLRASFLDEQKQRMIAAFLNSAVERQDTRLVEESLAHLREALETHHDLKIDDWFAPRRENDIFQHFLSRLGELSRFLDGGGTLREMLVAMKQGRNLAGLEFNNVPRKRLDEAVSAVEAWNKLKKSPPKQNQKNLLRTYVSEILLYLGFALTSSDAARTEGVQVDDLGTDYVALSASLIHGDLARPIPQFGSQANGQYRIVCIWERPSIDSIVAQLTESNLTSLPVIALYLGRLTTAQRRELVQRTREDRLPLALLDETLLLYLGAAHNARFPIFLRCALPYATLSPYALQAGNVPPEIFYGRQEAIKRLSEQQGSCIVYGGRQLGKSALLRQVQRGFHHPEREDYAFFVDIKNVGDHHGDLKTEDLWSKIRDHLKEEGLLKRQVTATRPTEVARHIKNLLTERPQMRLLFLLDEADNFLDADAQSNFQEVDRLRSLMGDTNRRFRVIFAGLHNVQRFQGIPNQPLAHFGDPIVVGPLEAKAALDLVREPLQVMGFRFADDSVPLRMLSYTNYHPSLIQLFCQELLQLLHRGVGTKAPPYQINQNDVEAVYRRRDVSDRIRERFDWTLALDARYQTIAYALVENQLESEESYGTSYSIPEVLRLVQSWWQNGFKEIDQGRLQGLLDEMVGLGILVRSREGGYRLRSPNLVRLMGSAADIESRLLELSTRPAPTEYSADHFHALLNDAKPNYQYSPLSYAQERDLTRHQSGVTLLFASDAQGFADLPSALKKFERMVGEVEARVVREVSNIISYPDQLRNLMMESWKTHHQADQIYLYYQVKPRFDIDVYALVECALQYCASLHTSKRCLQVIFLFNHEAAWKWLTTDPQRRQNIEKSVTTLHPYPWDRTAICQRLEQQSKLDSDDVCKLIAEVTGGWPFLLDLLMQRSAGEQDLRPLVKAMSAELKQPKSGLFSQFRAMLGIAEASPAATLLRYAVEWLNDSHDPIDAELLALAQSENEIAFSDHEFQDAVEYLVRMGCLRPHGESFILAPMLYQLFKQP